MLPGLCFEYIKGFYQLGFFFFETVVSVLHILVSIVLIAIIPCYKDK